jgi:hypothetical protein
MDSMVDRHMPIYLVLFGRKSDSLTEFDFSHFHLFPVIHMVDSEGATLMAGVCL